MLHVSAYSSYNQIGSMRETVVWCMVILLYLKVSFKRTTHQYCRGSWNNWGCSLLVYRGAKFNSFHSSPLCSGSRIPRGTCCNELANCRAMQAQSDEAVILEPACSILKVKNVFLKRDAVLAKCIFSSVILSALF